MSGIIGFTLTGDWDLASRVLEVTPRKLRPVLDKASRAEAEEVAGRMRKNLLRVRPANARITRLLKGSSRPLVNDGDLLASIGVQRQASMSYYVGIPRGTREEKLARIHEGGMTIVQEMTDKQRRFLHARLPGNGSGKGSGTGIIVIHIPARPFIKPTFEQASRGAARRFMDYVVGELGL